MQQQFSKQPVGRPGLKLDAKESMGWVRQSGAGPSLQYKGRKYQVAKGRTKYSTDSWPILVTKNN